MPPYVYLAVRSDLTVPQKIVQASHAAQLSGAEFGCPEHCHMVVFEVNSLNAFCEAAAKADVHYSLFYEPDNALGYTAACTEPVSDLVRSTFRKFELADS